VVFSFFPLIGKNAVGFGPQGPSFALVFFLFLLKENSKRESPRAVVTAK
jgi:hypothetical protein